MKKFFTLLVTLFFTVVVFSQAPQKMSYQAVVRNGSNELVKTTAVGMKISILQGSETGTPVYIETQTPSTNANGLVTIEIGGGTVISGDFTTIDWSTGNYFIKTETDPAGGTTYTISGTSQLLSVPYALYAKTATNYSETDPIFNAKFDFTGATINDLLQFNGTKWVKITPSFSISTKSATYRWATFTTYEQYSGWALGNDPNLFGGVTPANWTDFNYQASQMSSDKEILRTLFTQKGYASKNAMIMNEDWMSYSSTNGKIVMALFRIKNTTGSDITWNPSFYYSAYNGWGEYASVALNGVSKMYVGASGFTSLALIIPASRVSTVIFVSTSGIQTGGMRNCRLAFYNNSLLLPAGLVFVDDLDVATGGWEQ